MKADRFDAVTRLLGGRSSRRAALAASAVALAGLLPLRAARPGTARDPATPAASPVGTPAASPVATPGLLDILSGSSPAAGGRGELARFPDCCQEFRCVGTAGDVVDVYDLRDDPCPGRYALDRVRERCDAEPACGRRGCDLVCSDGREEDKEDLPGFTPA